MHLLLHAALLAACATGSSTSQPDDDSEGPAAEASDPPERPAPAWHQEPGEGADRSSFAPTAFGELVVVGSGSDVVALDPATGQTRWTFDTGRFVSRGQEPVQTGGVIFVRSQANPSSFNHHRLHAIDLRTGEEKWHHEVFGDLAQVEADFDRVYLAGRVEETAEVGGRSGRGIGSEAITVFDVESGEILRRLPVRAPFLVESGVLVGSVTEEGSGIGGDTHHLVAVDAESGEERWRQPLDDEPSTPVAFQGSVILGTGDALVRRTLSSGEATWTAEGESDHHQVALAGANVCAMVDTFPDETLRCVDLATGEDRWRETVDDLRGFRVAEGLLLHAVDGSLHPALDRWDTERGLFARDLGTGEVAWVLPAEAPVRGAPLLVDDTLVYDAGDAGVYGVAIPDGEATR